MDSMVTANELHYEEFAYSTLTNHPAFVPSLVAFMQLIILAVLYYANKIICQTVISKVWR